MPCSRTPALTRSVTYSRLAILDDDRVDAVQMQQMAKQQPRRTGTHNPTCVRKVSRLQKRRGTSRRLEPLVVLEDRGQLVAEPDAARLVVESTMPVQLQVVGDVEGRQRRGNL